MKCPQTDAYPNTNYHWAFHMATLKCRNKWLSKYEPMKQLCLFLLCFGLIALNGKSQIVAAEYFFDSDPGNGNATAIAVSPGQSININKDLSVTGLTQGFHYVAVRTKSANGQWGIAEARGFYITQLPASMPDIVAAEYFYDTDPGLGNGTPVNIQPGGTATIAASFPVGALSKGFHYIAVRTKLANGKWGIMESRGFYVTGPLTNKTDIVASEYYFDTDPGIGNAIPIPITPPTSLLSDSMVLPLGELPTGSHHIAIRVKNSMGVWSLLESRKFNICTNYGAVSRFSFQIEGKQVFFTNNSEYNDSTRWEFGDGSISNVLNPIKTYNPGVYPLRLISVNNCAIDTASITLTIKGLQDINAKVAGNNGVSTIIYEGVGFTPQTECKVVKSGNAILPVKKQYINETRILATYDFRGKSPGVYDAVAVLGGAFDTLKNGLTMEQDIPITISPTLQGASVFRTNRFQRSLSLKNNGSNDAVLVPVFASVPYYPNIAPGTFNANFRASASNNKVAINGIGIFQSTLQYLTNNGIPLSVMDENVRDTIHKKHTIAYYMIKILGHQSAQTDFSANNSGIVASHPMFARAYKPLLSSAAAIGEVESTYLPCYSSFLKHEVQKQLNIILPETNWNHAFAVAFQSLLQSMHTISQLPVESSAMVSMPSVFSALLAQMASTPSSGVPSNLSPTQFRLIIEGLINNWAMLDDIGSIGNDCIDPAYRLITETNHQPKDGGDAPLAYPALKEPKTLNTGCDNFDPDNDPYGGVSVGMGTRHADNPNYNVPGTPDKKDGCSSTSVDPNTKTGPGNNIDRFYINHGEAVGYTIQFENLAAATSPAAYVEINDTLNPALFDLSTLEMTGLGWGDSTIGFEPNTSQISFLKDLRPAMPNYLRADITTNTTSGAIQWRFYTVDTVNYQLTGDPAEGFLPPNTDGIKGQGYVSFIVNPKSGYVSGTTFSNEATIIFDENTAIHTGKWTHKIDTTLPLSKVQNLPATVPTKTFQVNWNGTDEHSGIDKYTVFVSINDSAFFKWKDGVTETFALFDGEFGKTYKFFSIAFDKAGNAEALAGNPMVTPDAATTPLAPDMFISIKDGNWNNPATWSSNQVPTSVNDVIIKHQVTINVNAACKTLNAVTPGFVNVNAGMKLEIKQ